MRAGVLRRRLAAAVEAALRTREGAAIAVTADRAKAMGVALAGMADDAEVTVSELELTTRMAAVVLGFHPEHVRRLIRGGRVPARRIGGDYRIRVDDLWPLIRARHRATAPRRPASHR
jgi:excisionase family DNA binding protein